MHEKMYKKMYKKMYEKLHKNTNDKIDEEKKVHRIAAGEQWRTMKRN